MSVMTPAYSHVHSALASAVFNTDDAVMVRRRGEDVWAVYLDKSLSRWEAFIDAPNGRVFVHPDTWDSLDGPAQVAFESDFITAYRGRSQRELRILSAEVYQAGARRRAAAEGTAVTVETDRIKALQARADEAVLAAAGAGEALSAAQSQVFAVRHAQLVEDLAGLEAEMARLRSSVDFSASVLLHALG